SAVLALVAFLVGGLLAGRVAGRARRDGGLLHGVLVWALATAGVVAVAALGGGVLGGDVGALFVGASSVPPPSSGSLAQSTAAALSALGDLLQRRSMRADRGPRDRPVGLVAQLVRRPRWLAGLGASVIGLCVHVVALSTGTIVAVQPLLVLEFTVAVIGTCVL